jgi:gas vesicle protein
MEAWKTRTMVIGAVIGGLAGLAAAYLLVQQSTQEEKARLSAGQGVQVGLGVLGVLRLISEIGKSK